MTEPWYWRTDDGLVHDLLWRGTVEWSHDDESYWSLCGNVSRLKNNVERVSAPVTCLECLDANT